MTTGAPPGELPLLLSRSTTGTESNRTGSWRFFRPRFSPAVAPCSAACPVGADIARIQMLAGQGAAGEAIDALLAENPFPAVCGRVCFHSCEAACLRAHFDAAVGIRGMERFLGDLALAKPPVVRPRKPSRGAPRAVIVGGGPAGLSAAYFLSGLGWRCRVLEARSAAGGLLRWGIPPYRLPAGILEAEIDRIAGGGVEILYDTPVSDDRLAEAQGDCDGIFLATGRTLPIGLGIPGADAAIDGLALLRAIRRGQAPILDGPVAVVGGGNTAVDVARCLIRIGAEPVIVYRRRRQDMPAFPPEIEAAQEEGIRICDLRSPAAIAPVPDNAGWELTLQEMRIDGREISGRARIVPRRGSCEQMRVLAVVAAIGAEAGSPRLPGEGDGRPEMDLGRCRVRPGHPPLVRGGDLTNDLLSVADAVASGKQGAMVLDTLVRRGPEALAERIAGCRVGGGHALSMEIYRGGPRQSRESRIVRYEDLNTAYFRPADRVEVERLAAVRRRASFEEIEIPWTEAAARREADRCFNCGLCNGCDNCRIFCPELSVSVDGSRRIDLDYCKGCGLCATECPRAAIRLEKETG